MLFTQNNYEAIWKYVKWQTMQYSAGCKDICAICVSSRVSEDPVLHF